MIHLKIRPECTHKMRKFDVLASTTGWQQSSQPIILAHGLATGKTVSTVFHAIWAKKLGKGKLNEKQFRAICSSDRGFYACQGTEDAFQNDESCFSPLVALVRARCDSPGR